MTDKLDVKMFFEAKRSTGEPFADMTVNYYGMDRYGFAGLEVALMDMWKGLAAAQQGEVEESPNGLIKSR